jgi:hypothetical protein
VACTAPARGARQTPPHTGPAFNDVTDNNPCGRRHVVTANGVNVGMHSLCIFHLKLKLGEPAVQPPYADIA